MACGVTRVSLGHVWYFRFDWTLWRSSQPNPLLSNKLDVSCGGEHMENTGVFYTSQIEIK